MIQRETAKNFFFNLAKISTYLVFLTPFVFLQNTFFPFVSFKGLYFFLISEIVFFSFLCLLVLDRKYLPKLNLILISLSFFLLSLILSTFFGVDPLYSFWSKFERMTGLLLHFHLFGFFLAISSLFKPEDFKKFFLVSIISASLLGLDAILKRADPTFRGGGLLGNESFLGTYLLFNLFFALFLSLKEKGIIKTIATVNFFLIFIFLLLIGVQFPNKSMIFAILYKEGARAAKISAYGGLILVLLLHYIFFAKIKILRYFLASLLIVGALIGSYALYSVNFLPKSFFRGLLEKEVGHFGGRFFVWESAKKAFFEKPIFGWGPENFEFAFLKHYNPCFGVGECGLDIWYDRAHNVIFDTLVTGGIVGVVSYFFLFFSVFYSLFKKFLKEKKDFTTFSVFSSLLVSYFIQNTTVFDMPTSWILFYFLLAFLSSFLNFEERAKKEKPIYFPLLPSQYFLLFFLVFLFFLSFYYFLFLPLKTNATLLTLVPKTIEILPSSSFQSQKGAEKKDQFIFVNEPYSQGAVLKKKYLTPEERVKICQMALSYSQLGIYQNREFCAEQFFSFLRSEAKNVVSKEELEKEMEFLEKEFEKSVKQNSFNYRALWYLGRVLTFHSQFNPQKAKDLEKVALKLLELSPNNQKGFWALSQALILQGKIEEAILQAEKAINLEKRLKESHLFLISILKDLNREDLLKEKIQKALEIDPSWEKDIQEILK